MPLSRQERYRMHVGWLDRHLSDFGRTEGVSEIQQIQRTGELALALRARVLTEETAGSPGWTPWRDALVAHLDRAALRERSRNQLAVAHAWLMPYVILRGLGLWTDPWHDETLRAAGRQGFPESLEVVPYRKADHLFFLQMTEPSRLPELHAALALTYLASGPTAIHADRDAAYSVTHTILYATSFGLTPVPEDWPLLDDALRFVQPALLRFARRRDWDLVGELLICLTMLPGGDEHLLLQAETLFAGAVRDDGAVYPSEATARATAKALAAGQQAAGDADFEAMYHTTLVGLFLSGPGAGRRAQAAGTAPGWRRPPVLDPELAVALGAAGRRAAGFLDQGAGDRATGEGADAEGADESRAEESRAEESRAEDGGETATIGWGDAAVVDRVALASTLRARPHADTDPEVLVTLAHALAAERDYANLIGVLQWLLDLDRWDDRADVCLQLLLDHQLPDGRLGLLESSLAQADRTTRSLVYSTLTDRFARLSARLLSRQPAIREP